MSSVVDCVAGGNYFSINFGWPLIGEEERVSAVKKFGNRMPMTPNLLEKKSLTIYVTRYLKV